jgi:hypothetical protein
MFIDLKEFTIYKEDKIPPAAWLLVLPGPVEDEKLAVFSLGQILALRGTEEELPQDLNPQPWGHLTLPQYKIDRVINWTARGEFTAIRPYSGSKWGKKDQEMQIKRVRRKDLIWRNILSWVDIAWLEVVVYRSVLVYRAFAEVESGRE